MSTILGIGDYRYRVDRGWAKAPRDWKIRDVGGVGVDKKDNVYVFNRGKHPMIVFNRDGNVITTWGEGVFPRAHGVHMDPDGESIWLTDDGDHTVRKCALDGKVLLTIGMSGKPAPYMSGEPFNRCTHTALSPEGDLYVSDGYGNAQVHKFSDKGKLLFSWGGPGTDAGLFNLPHNIHCDEDGWVYVADRENHSIQVFNGKGEYETQWNNLHRPSGMHLPTGKCPICFVGEIGSYMSVNKRLPNLGPRITIVDNTGKQIGRLGLVPDAAGIAAGQFLSPHGMCSDSYGDLYVGEVAQTSWPSYFPDTPIPDDLCGIQKLVKVEADAI
jgi:hypothetical protein